LDPDEAGAEEISQELTRQLATQIVPRKRKHRSIQRFIKNFEMVSTEISSPSKIHLAKQLEHQKLPKMVKGQCLPSAVHGG
jgi:hypothetical protein